ncbi:putative 7-deoxyloganetin glucosyltransferase [Medicago truncatula]|uniref:Glycosyltransferase n=1 Tax=Medicago truncatula TaxID=3880 RepID=Q2HT79_MEDTR|nr:7-deoxyloganetin glucosyltransferase isoform X2 [Medicago truncatula]ABD32727.1 UDP-glucuronosyl/UDP-glucosyltransferase [Medicago truncatula]ABN08258.1 UDP-glucuronosyl/UDP-glucosyltransferase [Medicago truncatula]AES77507.2 UDP-glucosyltransferase family protein [Medicago truncatula]RHN44298.1 putative 7-deoxyloganetin glucosyltransferase [Medicago truncatula]
MSYFVDKKPHAVLIPYPLQGHINPLLKLAKLLHLKGFHITFVNTEYNHNRLLKSRGSNSLDGFTDFVFETIQDGLTPMEGNGDVSQDLASLCQSVGKNFIQPFGELLRRIHDSADAGLIPPVTCLVADFYMPFTIQVAEENALPILLFSPASACNFLTTFHFRTIFDKGLIPLKGLQNFRLKDLPDIIRVEDRKDPILEFVIEVGDSLHKASAIIFNTYDELESDVMNALYSVFPSLYTIGPLPSLLNQTSHNHLASLGSNLWKEDTKCLEWLESKGLESVVYVSFGSITVMTQEQLLEFAWGLANSKKPFLWIIRPDLVIGGSFIMSSEFEKEISDRGLIASWCPQEQVLNHPSIGGFLTHCGWNSTVESVLAGVPMLCWPFYGDQPINCRYICNIWEIGIEIDTNVKREEVEKLINELMVGDKGKKMRQNVAELKKKAEENTSIGGCSYMNLDKVIKEVLLKKY